MSKLVLFKTRDYKLFTFTTEQYINLEIEYNRYIIYKELITTLEAILIPKHAYNTQDNIKYKIYEHKNIIDRFILECINHGISPNIYNTSMTLQKYDVLPLQSHTKPDIFTNNSIKNEHSCDILPQCQEHTIVSCYNTSSTQSIDKIEIINKTEMKIDTKHQIETPVNIDNQHDDNEPENMNNIRNLFLFNKYINNVESLRQCVYFNKMLSEYNEKHIKITPIMRSKLEDCIIDMHKKFIRMNTELFYNKNNKANCFEDIICSIYIDTNDNYVITYKNYIKTINFNRYSKLINNYNRPYPYDIIKMILRYSIFDSSNQQWSIGINLYDHISILFDISFELFASPLNFNLNMFCSLFVDTDKVFGSIGSFYNISITKLLNSGVRGVFYNPPYLPILMSYTIKICLDLLCKMNELNIDFTIISFLPNWYDAVYIHSFLKSKYLVHYKIIKRGDFVLHEKDKGKLINGTFELLYIVLNSKKASWDKVRTATVQKNFNDIVNLMKAETMS